MPPLPVVCGDIKYNHTPNDNKNYNFFTALDIRKVHIIIIIISIIIIIKNVIMTDVTLSSRCCRGTSHNQSDKQVTDITFKMMVIQTVKLT